MQGSNIKRFLPSTTDPYATLNSRPPLRLPSLTYSNVKCNYIEYLLVLENVLSSHLILFLDDFSQRENGLYFREHNRTFSCHLSRGVQHIQNMLLNRGQRLLGM